MAKITPRQIQAIVEDYRRLLPDWLHITDTTLVRTEGPVLQAIAFECLLSGEYRPLNYVQVLVVPEPARKGRTGFFEQVLKGRPKSALLRSHQSLLKQMVETMKKEFVPSIAEPLDPAAILAIGERDEVFKSSEAYALAGLNAYLGRYEQAHYWSTRYNELVDQLGQLWQDWHHLERKFLNQLEEWIKRGVVQEKLDQILNEEREKWELPLAV